MHIKLLYMPAASLYMFELDRNRRKDFTLSDQSAIMTTARFALST